MISATLETGTGRGIPVFSSGFPYVFLRFFVDVFVEYWTCAPEEYAWNTIEFQGMIRRIFVFRLSSRDNRFPSAHKDAFDMICRDRNSQTAARDFCLQISKLHSRCVKFCVENQIYRLADLWAFHLPIRELLH